MARMQDDPDDRMDETLEQQDVDPADVRDEDRDRLREDMEEDADDTY